MFVLGGSPWRVLFHLPPFQNLLSPLLPGGGALGYFLGGYVPLETPNGTPFKKEFPLKLIPRYRIRPKTDTPF